MGPSALAVVPQSPGAILVAIVYMEHCFKPVLAFALASVKQRPVYMPWNEVMNACMYR